MGGLNRGNGAFIHKLRYAVPSQQHAEQVIGGDLALQHHTIDQEHRDRMAGLATGVEENFLQKPGLTMVHRKSVVWGKSVSARVEMGCRRILKHTKKIIKIRRTPK